MKTNLTEETNPTNSNTLTPGAHQAYRILAKKRTSVYLPNFATISRNRFAANRVSSHLKPRSHGPTSTAYAGRFTNTAVKRREQSIQSREQAHCSSTDSVTTRPRLAANRTTTNRVSVRPVETANPYNGIGSHCDRNGWCDRIRATD